MLFHGSQEAQQHRLDRDCHKKCLSWSHLWSGLCSPGTGDTGRGAEAGGDGAHWAGGASSGPWGNHQRQQLETQRRVGGRPSHQGTRPSPPTPGRPSHQGTPPPSPPPRDVQVTKVSPPLPSPPPTTTTSRLAHSSSRVSIAEVFKSQPALLQLNVPSEPAVIRPGPFTNMSGFFGS